MKTRAYFDTRGKFEDDELISKMFPVQASSSTSTSISVSSVISDTQGESSANTGLSLFHKVLHDVRGNIFRIFSNLGKRSPLRSGNDSSTFSSQPSRRVDTSNRGPRATRAQYIHQRHMEAMEHRKGFRMRFVTAISGGLALIVPMLIMSIHPLKKKTLITASISVFVFALGLAWQSSAKRQELLAVTSAYAAVMVVFVGVSGP